MEWRRLFKEHITIRLSKMDAILEVLGLNGAVFDSGINMPYFGDTQTAPFRVSPHFAHFCPARGDGHLLHIQKGKKPLLYYFSPEDFWYEHIKLGDSYWTSEFDIIEKGTDEDIWKSVGFPQNTAYYGPNREKAESIGLKTEVPTFMERLNWERSFKTPYEVKCIEEAAKIASRGHKAAKQCFDNGGSELEIYYAYLRGARLDGSDLPYGAIVALNEKSAILHYPNKRDHVDRAQVLLVDAGAYYQGYAADITRTYANGSAPSEFKKLIRDMDELQQKLCSRVVPGILFSELHHEFHKGLATLLLANGIIANCSEETALNDRYTYAFCPHGLGHMLGIQTHDVAGHQKDPIGNKCDGDERYPKLRTTRMLELGFLLTIEPGLYFIEMLLAPFRNDTKHKRNFNWSLIDKLAPCGGIRIEDDIYITEKGPVNLTRGLLV
ncbi:MAG: Xaa-Pro dipeptidase [Oligoflexales bacterium]|nr:Xaa-Pro dipeptidase [Oligoflexales bacterium]